MSSEEKKITVTHCPTERMIADNFIKPLLGNLLTSLRNIVMGITPYPAKERVGNEVCPNTECEEINSCTADTESTRTEVNGTTDDVVQV